MGDGFHQLRVLDTCAVTEQATSFRFAVPTGLSGAFRWLAGQHLTLRFWIDGVEVRRSYSISETPSSGDPLRITVKRVEGGLVSNHINDRITAGDIVDVMPPFGGFCLEPEPKGRRTYYFFGAGSGITPLYAMIRTILVAEPYSVAYLAYGNANADSIIFREPLVDLENQTEGRLVVRHVLTSPSWMSSFSYWRRGRIDAEAIAAFIDEHPPYAQDAQYYVCGPGGMNTTVRAALQGLGVPDTRIHTESYGASEPPDDSVNGITATTSVRLNGASLVVPISAGQAVLDAVRASGANPPYSCESGVCGACRAHLRNGKVHLRARMALTDSDVERGIILTCQALPTTPQLAVEYD